MDTATITRPGRRAAGPAPADSPSPSRSRRARRAATRAGGRSFHAPALALLLLVTFLLRLWGIKQGLPYSYNVDEAQHFVPRAVAFFGHDLNPHYFLNPPAYSYLLHIVFELWFGSSDAVSRAYATNPTDVYVVARVVAAVLGTAAVWLTYLAGTRFFNRNVGLLAAAMFGLAFLPIFYSHLALNDVPTLAPVALSLYGTSGVMKRGRLRDYLIAGVGVGLAAATKYTGGITLLCLGAAFVSDAVGGAAWVAVRRFGAALLLALIAFVIANPYSVLDPSAFQAGVNSQASLAAGQDPVKLGTRPGSGTGYYLWTFTWGLGWGPTLAAIGGSVLLVLRRRLAMAMVLIPAPIVFVIFMGHQQRYFGRWLMPVFPIVAILGAYGAVELVRWLIRARRIPVALAAGIVVVAMLAQGFIASVHDDVVLSRPDTRNLARAWMVNHVPPGSKVVIEPVVADNWASDIGKSLGWTPTGDRWYRFPTWMTQLDAQGNPLPSAERSYVVVDQYERYLQPALLNLYVSEGYCWVVTGSFQAGRAFAQPKLAPAAIAYYGELASRARLVYHVSPFSSGARAVPFNFDWATDYYPRQYHLPGPELSVYKLSGGKCG
jgi:4-amino-4-deoxy-L-arabinose transferase-like glycosyltransferase